ncbi:putative wall-associated receptor kinase-like 16 [Gastrolobium bilobum]|uniref:putative wall-associated receptor kinase-like 16 n=1 Tax=Gastrolobium bilobum TaxID=150636 RepID=UPI002AB1F8F7|nr:putative wall-associated receptor kinase-like 16 [Gastrolobium bilobum]
MAPMPAMLFPCHGNKDYISASVLHYIRSRTKLPINHRAVKSCNILLDENLMPKVADFGLCKKQPHEESKPKPPKFELRENLELILEYMNPEYHATGWLSEKSDVYSFGVVLLGYFLHKGRVFFDLR